MDLPVVLLRWQKRLAMSLLWYVEKFQEGETDRQMDIQDIAGP